MIRGLIYSVVSAVCFGMMAVLAKLGYAAGLSGREMLQYRFVFGSLLLLAVFLVRDRSRLAASPKLLAKAALLGGVLYVLQSTLFFRALETIPASTTALLFYFYPVTVTLLAAVCLKQRIDRRSAWSLALVMSGCALVFYDAFLKSLSREGLVCALGAMALFSVYLLLVQILLRGEDPLRFTFSVVVFAALAFTLWNGPAALLDPSPKRLALGLVMGLVPTALAISLLYLAVERIGSAWVSIFSTFEPVATITAAHLVLGEEVVWLQFVGAGLIIAGIVLPNACLLRTRRQAAPAS